MNPTHNPPASIGTDVLVTPAELLRGAARYLQLHGWHQGDMFTNPDMLTPAACALGAIRMAICGGTSIPYTAATITDTNRVADLFAAHIDVEFDPHRASSVDVIGDWNDEPDRTADDVIAALREAADDWDRIHGGAQ